MKRFKKHLQEELSGIKYNSPLEKYTNPAGNLSVPPRVPPATSSKVSKTSSDLGAPSPFIHSPNEHMSYVHQLARTHLPLVAAHDSWLQRDPQGVAKNLAWDAASVYPLSRMARTWTNTSGIEIPPPIGGSRDMRTVQNMSQTQIPIDASDKGLKNTLSPPASPQPKDNLKRRTNIPSQQVNTPGKSGMYNTGMEDPIGRAVGQINKNIGMTADKAKEYGAPYQQDWRDVRDKTQQSSFEGGPKIRAEAGMPGQTGAPVNMNNAGGPFSPEKLYNLHPNSKMGSDVDIKPPAINDNMPIFQHDSAHFLNNPNPKISSESGEQQPQQSIGDRVRSTLNDPGAGFGTLGQDLVEPIKNKVIDAYHGMQDHFSKMNQQMHQQWWQKMRPSENIIDRRAERSFNPNLDFRLPNEKESGKLKEENIKGNIVIAFCRMNPFTKGHQKLIEKVRNLGELLNADHEIILTRSHDKINNPLSLNEKLLYARRFFPEVKFTGTTKEAPTILFQLERLREEGYENITIVAGSDRVKSFENLISEYNIPNVLVLSAGNRTDNELTASKLREAAKIGDFFTFKNGVPSHLSEDDAMDLYLATRKGLQLEGYNKYNEEEVMKKPLREHIRKAVIYSRHTAKLKEDITLPAALLAAKTKFVLNPVDTTAKALGGLAALKYLLTPPAPTQGPPLAAFLYPEKGKDREIDKDKNKKITINITTSGTGK